MFQFFKTALIFLNQLVTVAVVVNGTIFSSGLMQVCCSRTMGLNSREHLLLR